MVSLKLFLRELLAAISLCKVLGFMMRDYLSLSDCFFYELIELLIADHMDYSK